MIKFEWMMSYAICDGMFDNAFLAFEDAKRVKENSETIVIVATKPNGINLGEQCLGSAVYNRNGDRIACEKSLEYLFPKSMKLEREWRNKIRAVLEGGNE